MSAAVGQDKNQLCTSHLIVPFLVQLVYQSVLRIDIPAPTGPTAASATNCANESATTVIFWADVAVGRRCSSETEAVAERGEEDDEQVLFRGGLGQLVA